MMRISSCWEKLLTFVGLMRPPYSEFRTIYVNHKPLSSPSDQQPPEEKYPSNRIVTSRYTIITFPIKNLLEQFTRVANFYFLIIAVVQLMIDTPVSPVTSIVPLVFVLSVTAVKQAYEDFLRHRADDRVNNTPVCVIANDTLAIVKAHMIRVGDVIRVHKNESFPCDMLLLASSEESGECSITTANLDGETNLKTVFSVEETRRLQTVDAIARQLRAKISCEQPTADLYKFKGNLSIRRQRREKAEKVPLSAKNLLLRGAVLRNTESVFGVAIYTGQETKMQLNSQQGRAKKSIVEKRLDRFLLCFMVFLLAESAFCTVMKWIYAGVDSGIHGAWYLPTEEAQAWRVVQDLLGFIVLFNYLIPISLYVTIELQKFIGSIFFEFDLEMYYEDPDTGEKFRAKANTSDLNEELGQVQYLFSDKTGTLTENRMTFRLCSINGRTYCDSEGQLWETGPGGVKIRQCRALDPAELKFFTVLALCHTVRVERTKSFGRQDLQQQQQKQFSQEAAAQYVFQASSPDEKAFVEAARNYGVTFHGTEGGVSTVTLPDGSGAEMTAQYRVMQVLEFDSDRKCMSLIVQRCSDGSYWLLTKGAETSMLERCNSGNRDAIVQHSAEFAVEGLRVLVIACRELSPAEYQQMSNLLLMANQDVANREARLVEAYQAVERGLEALGLTAIEDELQTGVRETIIDLRAAGIQVWILTGDKRETAENISLSAGHFDDTMQRIRIVEQPSPTGCLLEVRRGLEVVAVSGGVSGRYCIVVDGQSLQFLVADDQVELKSEFLALCQLASAVLCCRCTPLQKARVVAMVRDGVRPKPVTCAIGDGANDVSMIREAHVGIGLFGKEGRAAALNSDYAFARFQYLRKALLFHGHLYYVRLATLVQYFFYKNVAFITSELFYAFYSGFSAQSLYDAIYLTIYNMTMTSLPILLYGLFEQHVQRQRLYQEPELYATIACNRQLRWRELLLWIGLGLWHSVCCHFGPTAILSANDQIGLKASYAFGVFEFGAVVAQCVLICVTMRLMLVSYSFSVPTLIGVAVSVICGFVLILTVYNLLTVSLLSPNYNYFYVYFDVNKQPSTWLTMLAVSVAALTPDLLIKCVQDSRTSAKARQRRMQLQQVPDQPSMPTGSEAVSMATSRNGRISEHEVRYNTYNTVDASATHQRAAAGARDQSALPGGYLNRAFEHGV